MRQIARFTSTSSLRQWALASVVANVALVGTGGAVRLTGSGLGCPTWPRCTDESYITTPAMGINGVIEFGNRMLGFVIAIIVLVGLAIAVFQRPRRRALIVPALITAFGIPAQGVIGGFTVLTNLNPWVVGLHFLASMAVIAPAYVFWRRAAQADREAKGRATPTPAATESAVPALRALGWIITVVSGAVLVLGSFVTGSGPHAGDADARRNGLDPATIAKVHSDAVFLLVGLSVALYFAFRALGASAAARATLVLVVVELAQGLIGFVQYATHLPAILVGTHMVGAALVWLATLAVLARTMPQRPAPAKTTPTPAAPTDLPDLEPAPVG